MCFIFICEDINIRPLIDIFGVPTMQGWSGVGEFYFVVVPDDASEGVFVWPICFDIGKNNTLGTHASGCKLLFYVMYVMCNIPK